MAGRTLHALFLLLVACSLVEPLFAARVLQQRPKLLGLDRNTKSVRVLAFGDSLTEGWIHSRWTKIPWTPLVQQKLSQWLGSCWSVDVVNGGIGSAGVLDRLGPAWRDRLSEARSQGKPYNYIIFMAGVNDLLMQNKNAPEILQKYKEMLAASAKEGSTVMVVPVLPADMQAERNGQRLKLNADLKAWVKQQQAAGNWSVYILDLEKQMNWFAMSDAQRKSLFDDGLHFTEYGYSVLGGYIADGLRKVMKI